MGKQINSNTSGWTFESMLLYGICLDCSNIERIESCGLALPHASHCSRCGGPLEVIFKPSQHRVKKATSRCRVCGHSTTAGRRICRACCLPYSKQCGTSESEPQLSLRLELRRREEKRWRRVRKAR
jgi:hypothetical protein